jgi:hypothetical protein
MDRATGSKSFTGAAGAANFDLHGGTPILWTALAAIAQCSTSARFIDGKSAQNCGASLRLRASRILTDSGGARTRCADALPSRVGL